MSVVDAIRERQCRMRFGGWPRGSWGPRTEQRAPTIFDAGDVDYMTGEILSARCPDAVDVMLTDAAVADLEADAAEDVDRDHATAGYYRDYARMVRLACRIAARDSSLTPPEPKPRGNGQPPLEARDVKQRADIVAFIDHRVPLAKAGHDHFVGLCPFHDDHKPSMHVWSKGNWKCFSCGASGDVIEFARRYHGCEFREALEIVAGGQ